MRMWMINPELLCRKHLLGEHNELHKFKPSFEKQHNMNKRIILNQIEPSSMKIRHDELAQEMIRRGYKHQSEYTMPDISYIGKLLNEKVNTDLSYEDLKNRCEDCRKLIK